MSTPVVEETYTGIFLEAKKLLDYTVDALTEAGVDYPTRNYVTAGQAVYDCEQVVATIVTSSTGLPAASAGFPSGSTIGNCPLPWNVIVDVAIVRCCVVEDHGGAPPVVKLETDSLQQSIDGVCLQNAANARANEQWGNVAAQITFPPQSGGMMATVARYTVAVTV
jgi:hypothetical protein